MTCCYVPSYCFVNFAQIILLAAKFLLISVSQNTLLNCTLVICTSSELWFNQISFNICIENVPNRTRHNTGFFYISKVAQACCSLEGILDFSCEEIEIYEFLVSSFFYFRLQKVWFYMNQTIYVGKLVLRGFETLTLTVRQFGK